MFYTILAYEYGYISEWKFKLTKVKGTRYDGRLQYFCPEARLSRSHGKCTFELCGDMNFIFVFQV